MMNLKVTHSPYQIPGYINGKKTEGSHYVRESDDKTRKIFNGMVNIMDEAVGNLTDALRLV